MERWNDKRYHSLDYYLKQTYGEKVYKVAIDGGFTCPNRDGTLGSHGCIFCSAGGSGDFAASRDLDIDAQIEAGLLLLRHKNIGDKYIAFFQAFTNTYASIEYLEKVYMQAVSHPRICGLAIATRPDCLPEEVLLLLSRLNTIKPVWVELGLQTIHPATAEFIRRGYPLECFEKAVRDLNRYDIDIVVHTILGLPGESDIDMLNTVRYLSAMNIQGIKPQLLHVLEHTDLAGHYRSTDFHILTLEEYTDILIRCLELLPPDIVIHRITGDGPKSILIAPLWSGNKKRVLGYIHHEMKVRNTWQGRLYQPPLS